MNEEKERLEYVKDKARAAIVDAVARSFEIKTKYKSAYIIDLEVLFNCVEKRRKNRRYYATDTWLPAKV